MKVVVLYVGSSLLAPLKQAEREINRQYNLDLQVSAYNFGAPMNDDEWREIDQDLQVADIVFPIHVMDGENAARLVPALERYKARHRAVIVINCMPDLMRRTRMGKLDVAKRNYEHASALNPRDASLRQLARDPKSAMKGTTP